jgi:hypothetical protein
LIGKIYSIDEDEIAGMRRWRLKMGVHDGLSSMYNSFSILFPHHWFGVGEVLMG